MESAVANLVSPGEPAVVTSCGKFGERWAELCEAYGADTSHLEFEWGTKVDPDRVDRELGELDRPPRAVYVTQSETSTGVVNDIRALNEVARAHGSVLCVDAVSGLGAVELPQDEWGVDVVVAGSQKSLMCPPGLAFASVSDRAMALAAENPRGRYYLDWGRTAAGQKEEPPNSAFTPAVTLFRALDVALDLIFEEGLETVYRRHSLLARAARAGVDALGLERFGPDDDDANVVTVAALPDDIDGGKVPRLMRDTYGVTIAGGQGHLKGRIARIAHCGYYGAFDIVVALTALEMALRDLGHDAVPGSGSAGAQRVFAEAGLAPEPVA
jgi:aspartate aminotransferase-like enzyme